MNITAADLVTIALNDLIDAATECVTAFGKGEDANISFNMDAEQIFDKVDTGDVEFDVFRMFAVTHPQIEAILK